MFITLKAPCNKKVLINLANVSYVAILDNRYVVRCVGQQDREGLILDEPMYQELLTKINDDSLGINVS